MKTLTVIESAAELVAFAEHCRAVDDKTPMLPVGATLVFDGTSGDEAALGVKLEKADLFTLDGRVTFEDVLKALCERAGFKCHIT